VPKITNIGDKRNEESSFASTRDNPKNNTPNNRPIEISAIYKKIIQP
jgi:hypothetical protein